MSGEILFPPLTDFEPTRATLHAYVHGVGVIPRTHATFHPKWWHISLRVQPYGLRTNEIALPEGGSLWLEMDLRQHVVRLNTSLGGTRAFSMTEGHTSTEFGDQLIAAVADLGLEGKYARKKFEDDEARQYDPKAAGNYLTALINANRIFNDHRATLPGQTGPVQLWPHNFDLAFEWYGTRIETHEEHGEVTEYPSQINLGFYPAGDPYFYSNPWPFEEDQLLSQALPEGARWHTEGWQGTILPYSALAGDENAEQRLREYARRVFEISSPTLLV